MLRNIFISCCLLCAATLSQAQDTSGYRVSVSVDSAGIESFVSLIESQTGLHFYYNAADFDSLRISISVNKFPLWELLDSAFAGTAFHYTPAGQKKIFLTRGTPLQASLAENFFRPDTKDAGNAPPVIPDFSREKKAAEGPDIEQKLFVIGAKTNQISHANASIAGYIRNSKNGEPVAGAYVQVENSRAGVSVDQYGFYSLTLPRGTYTLNIQGLGMADTRRRIQLNADGRFNVDMTERVTSLKEVVISAAKVANVRRVGMGIERLSIQTIKQLPTVFGEPDILRAVLTLPGVKTVGEASAGFNVRGGSVDQNLILFNEATIFNPTHFFGFFSAFNPDLVKDVELYKSSIPAKYGGRLSSVLAVNSKEGNKKKIGGTAGIGPLTTRINLEGPIVKDKLSFMAGFRTTYANWILQFLPEEYRNSKANFLDGNLLLNYQPNNKNSFSFTGYTSKDKFNLNNDTSYAYSNNNLSAKWKHVFSNKFNAEVSGGYDQYDYKTAAEGPTENGFQLKFKVAQLHAKTDFTWFVHPKHTLDMGASFIRYHLEPGTYGPSGKGSLVTPDEVATEQGRELAAYISDRWNISTDFSVQAGLRYSYFSYLGPASIRHYLPGVPRTIENSTGVEEVEKGKSAANYSGPELRLSARYSITADFSIKAGYNSQRQYIHMLSNTTAISPTDIWKLSDPNIRPQYGQQVSLGFYKNFRNNTIETSVEFYYKKIQDYLDFRSGAVLVMNHHIETDVMGTKGKAYGAEFMVKKTAGKLTGWLSYTYSRILLKQDDPAVAEVINKGDYYPANYDKPHDVTFTGNYRFSHRFAVSMNVNYSTGRPITLPIGSYYYAGSVRALYADRNSHRIPDYFRMDLALNLDGNHKVDQRFHGSWSAGLYNLTGRRNAYSVYYVSEDGVINGYKLAIFGSVIPFINYNIRF